MSFFSKWVPEYHFPVKIAMCLVFAFGAFSWFSGRNITSAGLVVAALLVWCSMDMLTDWLKFQRITTPNAAKIKEIQAFGGVWAVIIAVAAIAARFAATSGLNLWTVVYGVILVGLMVYQVAHERTTGPDKKAAYASYAQQLIPAIMWVQLVVQHGRFW